jgi:hypothetical protein
MNPTNMTVVQAVEILDSVAQAHRGTRQDHINLQVAIKTIQEFIKPSLKADVLSADAS